MNIVDSSAERHSETAGRVSLDRLRERTDELELIISGLTTFALLSLPSWLLDQYAGLYLQLPLPALAPTQFALGIAIGLCYALGACFIAHLCVRAYWVGLIGLHSVYPGGIRWERARSLGPVGQADLRLRIPTLDAAIAGADRIASLIYAVISLTALVVVWIALALILLFLLAVYIGEWTGQVNTAITLLVSAGMLLPLVCGLLVWLLDAQAVRRWPQLAERRWLRRLLWWLRLPVRAVLPERLVAPVQLMLQTNTRPWIFWTLFAAALWAIPAMGSLRYQAYLQFDSLGTYTFLSNADVATGQRSAHYEDRQSGSDRLRAVPMIPAMEQQSAWLPLLLPYFPLRDDPLLRALCGEAPADRVACLRQLWEVRLNGQALDLSGFAPAERRDLGMRGLAGWVDLRALNPGPQVLEVRWRPASLTVTVEDYVPEGRTFHIPFVYAPQ
ncbi:MAG: hypothetical protein U1F26_13450 [Lysobacterales bacterium]